MPKPVNVVVTTPEAMLEFAIQQNSTGKQLFDQVCKTIGLREVWYFGLQYVDTKGNVSWVKLDKKIFSHKIRQETPLQFTFVVKFFPEDVSEELIQEITQRLFYLQVKKAIVSDEIYCPPETALLLASYQAQVRFGKYDPEKYTPGFMTVTNFLPKRVLEQHELTSEEWEAKIVKWFAEHREMPKEDAIMEYLKIAQDLEMYGVSYFAIKNKKGTDLWLGIDALGLNIYPSNDRLTPKIGFPWSEVRKISFNNLKFVIKPTDRSAKDFHFYTDHVRTNKRILVLSMGNHELYMRRRKADSIEVQQMKAQAKDEKRARETEREKLQAEREARELMEQRLREMELAMHEKEEAYARTHGALSEYQRKVEELEAQLQEEKNARRQLEEMQSRLEEVNKNLAQESANSIEARAAIAHEREVLMEKIREQQRIIEQSKEESRLAEVRLEKLRSESNEHDRIMIVNKTNGSGDKNCDQRELEVIENIRRPEESREVKATTDVGLAERLRILKQDLSAVRDAKKMQTTDLQHEDNVKKGMDKFKTLRAIRQGNTKKRVDEFESM